MHYWKIHVYGKVGGYDVYFRNEILVSDVPKLAVIDGHLLNCDYARVEYTKEITKEHYYEFMND